MAAVDDERGGVNCVQESTNCCFNLSLISVVPSFVLFIDLVTSFEHKLALELSNPVNHHD